MKTLVLALGCVVAALAPVSHAQECPDAPPPATWIKTVAALTAYAENSSLGASYTGIADDSDGQGMSVGILQWNFGQGTVTKIVDGTENVASVVASTMPVYGARFLAESRNSAVRSLNAAATQWVRDVQRTNRAAFHSEVRAFLDHQAVRSSQDKAAENLARDAWRLARDWMKDVRYECDPRFAQFIVFFDYLNHGGDANADEIKTVIQVYGNGRREYLPSNRVTYSTRIALGEASWTMALPHKRSCQIPQTPRNSEPDSDAKHVWDAQANCAIWTARIDAASNVSNVWESEIFLFAAIGAQFKPKREIFLNRKGTFALGMGVFNGNRCNFRSLYLAMENSDPLTLDQINRRVSQSCAAATHTP